MEDFKDIPLEPQIPDNGIKNQPIKKSSTLEYVPPEHLRTWMSDSSERIQNIPLWKMNIPGSHDCGTYGLEIESGISPDRPDLKRNKLMNICSCIALPVVHRWTKTQNLNLTQQLNGGIRYFDMRVASKTNDDKLYFVHGIYGPAIRDMLIEIHSFLIMNPREIVFIDFQHFYAVSDEDHKKLIEFITDLFGSLLVPYASQLVMDKFSLRYLWSKNQQVFVYYRDEVARMTNPKLWPARCLPNPWPNTMSIRKLTNFLTTESDKRPPNSMFVSQAILTPTDSYVTFHIWSTLISDLITRCNQSLVEWLNNKSFGPKGPKGPNIVMVDCIEWQNYKLPSIIIKLNS